MANCTIGMGYGLGAAKFLLTCRKTGVDLDPVPEPDWNLDRRLKFILLNVAHIDWRDPKRKDDVCAFLGAERVVRQWREANPEVVRLWKNLQSLVETAAENKAEEFSFTLPSGRRKTFFNPHFRIQNKVVTDPEDNSRKSVPEKRLYASKIRGDHAEALHGGPITENLIQAIARDVMAQGAVDVCRSRPHWGFCFNVYDEVAFEVPDAEAEEADALIPELLCRGMSAAWTKGLPLDVEGGIRDRYEK